MLIAQKNIHLPNQFKAMAYGKRGSEFVGILALLLAAAELVDGRVVNVSLGDTPGSALNGPAGGAGAVWNSWSPIEGILLDSDGNPTTVEVAAEGEGPYGDWWCDMQLLSGGLAARDQEVKLVRISGLDSASTYDIYLACARGERAANTLFSQVGPTSPVIPRQADNRSARNGSSWVWGQNYVLFQDLAPDATGTVAFSFAGVGTFGILNGLQIIEMGEPVTTYVQWASDPTQGLTPGLNDGPTDDADADGVINLIEFVTNSNPLAPSPGAQPQLLKNGSDWVFEYDRRDSSRYPSSEQVVEYSDDLLNWIPVPIPVVSSGIVTISDQGLFDRIRVRLPGSMEKLFARLRARCLTPFELWAADPVQGIAVGNKNGATDDPEGDGLPNLVEFALGSHPMKVSTGVTPSVSHHGEEIVFEYNRSDQSRPPVTTQVVQYSSDLKHWVSVVVPAASNSEVMITDNGAFDHVRVTIANAGEKLFMRLGVTE